MSDDFKFNTNNPKPQKPKSEPVSLTFWQWVKVLTWVVTLKPLLEWLVPRPETVDPESLIQYVGYYVKAPNVSMQKKRFWRFSVNVEYDETERRTVKVFGRLLHYHLVIALAVILLVAIGLVVLALI